MNCTTCNKPLVNPHWKQCGTCRAANAAKMRSYRARHHEEQKAYKRNWDLRQRKNVLAHYGGRCACCGETEFEFLSIDHVDGGGTKHRKEIGSRGAGMMRWLINNGYPDGFRVLCHNCNQAIGFYGKCPHERVVLELVRSDDG